MTQGEGRDRTTERKNIPHFSVNIHSRNKVDIGIWATDGALKLSSASPASPSPSATTASACSCSRRRRCCTINSPPHPVARSPIPTNTQEHSHRQAARPRHPRRTDAQTYRRVAP